MNLKIKLLFLFQFFLSFYLFSQNSSPYDCVINHLDNTSINDYNPKIAAKSFYTKTRKEGEDLAIKLKQVYDGKGIYIPVNEIPKNSNYTDTLLKEHKYYILPDRLHTIYVEKIAGKWYYSPNCYEEINKMYKQVYPLGSDLLYDNVPRFDNHKIFGIFYWQLISLVIIIVILVALYFLLKILVKPIISFIADKSFNMHMDLPVKYSKTSKIISALIVFYISKYAFALIRFPINISSFLITSLDIILAVLTGIFAYRVFDVILAFIGQLAKSTKSKMEDQYLPILGQLVKILIGIGILFKILVLLNVNVTAIIAGLSIGGLALALASQDTVKNLIGSIMIFMDKPFKVDDWIEVENYMGTVLEVGFRSTRIKQIDTSVIAVPNSIIANQALVNKGQRIMRMYETVLTITYNTPSVRIEAFITGLRHIAEQHPKIFGKYNINLQGLGASSINILFRIYLLTNDYTEELQLKQDITFLIIRLAETLGVDFAFPTQTIYIQKDEEETNDDDLYSKLNAFLSDIKLQEQEPDLGDNT
ncbi:MAG: mechanosensitive ion channel family protein [Saprospiraceae bacterium]